MNPKIRNIGLEELQNGIWYWVGSREGRKRKHEREACASICQVYFLEWVWKSVVGWFQVLSLEGKKELGGDCSIFSTGFHYRTGKWDEMLWPRH